MISPLPSSLRIGVLRGGPSQEYDASLKTGGLVLRELSKTHEPLDIFISKDGTWHLHGSPRQPGRILKNLDVVFNALHGSYGEDGVVQDILQQSGIAYTGSDRFASVLTLNKVLAKKHSESLGIKTPLSAIVRQDENVQDRVRDIVGLLPHPFIVKPANGGSAISTWIVYTIQELTQAIHAIHKTGSAALVEEYIQGREVTTGIIEKFRNKSHYVLPVAEITFTAPREKKILCPSHFPDAQKKEIEAAALKIHTTLGLQHYSQLDFIIHPRRGLYFLEVNSLPKLTESAPFITMLGAVGINTDHVVHHLLSLALKR